MNKKCENCNRIDNNNKFITTIDHHTVCMNCAEETQDYYKKGLISIKEVKGYAKLKNNYNNAINNITLRIKKHAKHYKTNAKELLKQLMMVESNLSEYMFHKGKGFHKTTLYPEEEFNGKLTINIDEHLKIIDYVMDNFDLVSEPFEGEDKIFIARGESNGTYYYMVKNKYNLLDSSGV